MTDFELHFLPFCGGFICSPLPLFYPHLCKSSDGKRGDPWSIYWDGRLLDLREKCVERVNKYLKITAVFNSITDRKFYIQTASDGQARVFLSHRDVWLVLFCFCYYYFFAVCGYLLHMTMCQMNFTWFAHYCIWARTQSLEQLCLCYFLFISCSDTLCGAIVIP